MLGCDDENYNVLMNPENIKRNEPHDALKITAKTKDSVSIGVVVRHNAKAEYSAMLSGE